MQVPLLAGAFADDYANFRASYPINMEPVILKTGLSEGFLRTAPGLTQIATGPGLDRGGINWNNFLHRVMGDKLVRLSGGVLTNLGTIPDTDYACFDYSFDRLCIVAGGAMRYWDGATLTDVTDPDLGVPIDVVWVDGYFMTTDSQYLVVTDLNDPYSINPLKYGSSEADPDPIVALRKVRNEVYAVNQFTIENFQNIGGSGFPFRRNPAGMIPKGACARRACAYFRDTMAFVGSGRDEALSVYIAGLGEAIPISTPEIDRQLAQISVVDRLLIEVESVSSDAEQRFYVHLPNAKTLVYSHQASLKNGSPVWHYLAAGVAMDQPYPARQFVFAENTWLGGTATGKIVALDETVETQLGATVGWQFDTSFLYNEGRGGIIRSAELVGLPGRAPPAVSPTAFMSWTQDGVTWSQERAISTGAQGQRLKRMQWRPKTKFSNYLGMRFRGANTALQGFARLEVDVEPLHG